MFSLLLIEFWVFSTQDQYQLSQNDDVKYEYGQEQRKNANWLKFFPSLNVIILIQNSDHQHSYYQVNLKNAECKLNAD